MNSANYPTPIEMGQAFGVSGADPAAGSPFVVSTVDIPNQLYLLKGLRFTLACDANPANRRPYLIYGPTALYPMTWQINNVQTAGQTRTYVLVPGSSNDILAISTNIYSNLPDGVRLNPINCPFYINIENIQVGDQLSQIFLYAYKWSLPSQ